MNKRASGILLPIFSLPSKYGIGSFSKEAYEFVDLLNETGQSYWQILPLVPVGLGGSPYQSYSSFAGNPYFIDIDDLISDNLLDSSEELLCNLSDTESIDYELQEKYKIEILRKAHKNFNSNKGYKKFCSDNANWLDEYALFMVIRGKDINISSYLSDDNKKITKSKFKELLKTYKVDLDYYRFEQYIFYSQWFKLKKYANSKGIKIIGDIPIYVSMDSAEVWFHGDELMAFKDGRPEYIAGCPPDAFTEDGQLWGNPLYDWEKLKKTEYSWWIDRIKHALSMYDVVRIDHFRGFESYYCIKYGAKTAKLGKWKKGPGYSLFKKVKEEMTDCNLEDLIIAEDLGHLTDGVKQLLKRTKFPGMKVLQFAFSDRNSDYLNYKHIENSVVYTGTHDNDTIIGWLNTMNETDKNFLREYLGIFNRNIDNWDIIRLATSSVSKLCIIPLADYIGLGSEGRINTPGTVGNNWNWRYNKEQLNYGIIDGIRYYTELYGRKK